MNESRHTYQVLLERGANADTRNALGYTALMWACARGTCRSGHDVAQKGCGDGPCEYRQRPGTDRGQVYGYAMDIYKIGGVA